METHGVIKAKVRLGGESFAHDFQLVSKQVEIPCDGILGRDFFRRTKAKICYATRVVTLKGKRYRMVGSSEPPSEKQMLEKKVRQIKLPPRTESIVRIPVAPGSPHLGIIEKHEIQKGVFLAATLTKVVEGHVLTSMLNTNDAETVVHEPVIRLEEVEPYRDRYESTGFDPQDREERILSQLRQDHLNSEERKSITGACSDFADVFYLPGDKLSSAGTVKHSINVQPGTEPINTRPYRLPEAQKSEIKGQVQKLLQEGIIEESDSPWNSPILLVPKKVDASGQQKFRLVVDYRKLNQKTIGNAYPLPDITEILDHLGQSKYFSCLDLAMGYHQIDMDKKDIDKTAFSTKEGHWAYRRMPFGLKTAPATFQRLMNTALSGLTGTRCFLFLDDIIIYANSLVEHDKKLRDVLRRLRKYNLKLQPDKCEFLRKEVSFLGHKISERGVEPDTRKVEAIENFPRPTTVKRLKSFLGLIGYYRRFVPHFSTIAAPLHKLLKKIAKFEWSEEQENAFCRLKQKLMSKPILQYPNFAEEFILTTDASNFGAGAVLSQGEIGKDLPIAYASRSFSKSEQSYSVVEKELAAVVWGVKYYRPFLLGRKFKIISDHKPLKWIMNVKDPGSRLLRWRIRLEEYDYEIVYKPGKQNANADALSRIGAFRKEGEGPEEIDAETKAKILRENHDSVFGGHRGMSKTYKAIRGHYQWPNMRQEIEEYVKKCTKCQINKNLREAPTVQYTYDDYVAELRSRMQSANEIARQRLLSSKEKSKVYYDRRTEAPDFQVGQRVLLFDETVRRGRSKKLSPQYIGPYEILEVEGVNVVIKRGRTSQRVHVNRIRPFY
jgi:hypothetical protein